MSTINNTDLFVVNRPTSLTLAPATPNLDYQVSSLSIKNGCVNPYDTFLVERSGVTYKINRLNLTSKLLATDWVIVERSGVTYKVSGADFLAQSISNLVLPVESLNGTSYSGGTSAIFEITTTAAQLAGDVIYVFASSTGTRTINSTTIQPAGTAIGTLLWNAIEPATNNRYICWKIPTTVGGPTTYRITFSNTTNGCIKGIVVRGGTTETTATNISAAASATITAPSVVNPAAGSLLLSAFYVDDIDSTTTITLPSTLLPIGSSLVTTDVVGGARAFHAGYQLACILPVGSPTGTRLATYNAATNRINTGGTVLVRL